MIVIAEKLNSSIPRIKKAVEDGDAELIKQIALDQTNAGADYLDVNAGVFVNDECEKLAWMIDAVRSVTSIKLMIDSPNPDAIEAGMAHDNVPGAIINSITLEPKRLQRMLPLVKKYNTGIVALPIDENGIPKTPELRLELAGKLVELLRKNGITDNNIYLDPLVETVVSDSAAASITIQTIRLYRNSFPQVHIACGLSNVSFGLPERMNINAAFLAAAVCNGLDAAILDITNAKIRLALAAANIISGQDEYCMDYINYCRSQKE